jgi:hypothetical protein
MNGMAWTPKKVERLRRLAAAGWGGVRIADRMGVSINAVRNKACELKISVRRGEAAAKAWADEAEQRRKDAVRIRWRTIIGRMREQLRKDIEA